MSIIKRSHRRQEGQVIVEFALVAVVLFGFIGVSLMFLLVLAQNFALGQAVQHLGESISTTGEVDTSTYIADVSRSGTTIDPTTDVLVITVTGLDGTSTTYSWGSSDFQVHYGDMISIEANQQMHRGPVTWSPPAASWNGVAQRDTPVPGYVYVPPETVGDVSGTIRDASTGKGIGGAAVTFSGGASTTSSTTGCPDAPPCGRYGRSGLTAGTYTVSTSASGYQPVSASVTVNQGSVSVHDFSLKQAAIIVVTVTDAGGGPIDGALVTTGTGLSAVAIGSGQYRLTVSPSSNPLTISVNTPPADGRSGSVTISDAAAGSTTSITVAVH